MLTVLTDGPAILLAGVSVLLVVVFLYIKKEPEMRTHPDDPFSEDSDSEDIKAESRPHFLHNARPTADIPGMQPSSPQLGNIADIAAAGSYFEFLVSLHGQYGTIAKFWHCEQLMVSLASPELFRQTSKAADRPFELFEVFSPLMTKESLGFTNGPEAKRRRAVYDPCLSFAAMENYIPDSQMVADEWVAEWKDKTLVSVKDFTLRYSMKAILQQLYGDFFNDNGLVIRMQENFDYCWHELESRARGDIPTPDSGRNTEFLKRRDDIFNVIEQLACYRHANPPVPGEEKLIDVVMEYCGEDMLTCKGELVNYIIGSYMSSGDILTWLIYFLSTNLDVQDKLFAELDDILGADSLSFQAIPHLTYLKQVIDESLRASLISTFVARKADTEMKLAGYLIPADDPCAGDGSGAH